MDTQEIGRAGEVAEDSLQGVAAADARFLRAVVGADLAVGARHRLGLDRRLALEGVRLVGIAVVAVQGPVQAGRAGRAEQQQG
jgi:hypothetical protein